jgi:Fic family protein
MWSFRGNRLQDPVDVVVASMMAGLGRFQGRQELFRHQAPQLLDVLRRTAMVESTEASNRIEGVVVSAERLRALMALAEPATRSEGEIAGYRDILARIHGLQTALPLTPSAILALHADLYSYLPGEGGRWKQQDNLIRQVLPNGREVVRFQPLPADETPQAMHELCERVAHAWDADRVDRLLLIDAFILDFLCIHPFADGNGRLARLLTLLLLYAAGYEVGRYVSLERIIEATTETYYDALLRSSQRWDSGNHDLTAWHQYSLGVLVRAYGEFEAQLGALVEAPGAKSHMLQAAVSALPTGSVFTIAALADRYPSVSRATIRRVLDDLRRSQQVECLGTGRSAQWRRL